MDASLAVALLPRMACMQKMQEQFSVQNGLIFGEPQATQIGLALFRASCPPPYGPAELFKIAPDNFVFAPLFWPRKKGARTPVRKILRSKES